MSAICASTTIKRKKLLAACQSTRLRADWATGMPQPPLSKEFTSATPGAAAQMLSPSRLGDLYQNCIKLSNENVRHFNFFLFTQYFGQSLQHAS